MILSFLRDQQLVTFAVLLLLTLFAVSSILEARSLAMLGALTAEKLRALVSLLRREGEAKVPEEKAGLERELVQRLRSVRVGFEDGKPVIARPLPAILDEWGHEIAEDGTAGLLGSSFTGIALVCTFLLIAWVLFTDVPAAIRATGNAKESAAAPMDALAEAVGKMGAKFVISSVGIVLAILHSFVHRDYVRRVMRATHRIAQTLSLEVVDLQSVQFLWANKLLLGTTSIAPAIARQEEVLATKLERLGKLEVVVKDLGSAVAASLGTLMKSALAEELSLVVADVRTLVEVLRGGCKRLSRATYRRWGNNS